MTALRTLVKKTLNDLGAPLPAPAKLSRLIRCVARKLAAGLTLKSAVRSCLREIQ
jgi:Flp pilus assembly protein TadB